MSDYNTHYAQGRVAAQGAAQVDAGLRAYMLGIYNYMALALLLTGVVAFGVGSYAEANPAVAQTLFGSPLKWVIIFAPLAVVMGLSFGINRLSASTAQLLFWLYAGLVGLSLSAIFLVYTNESIARTFFITAAAFGALSLYGYTTKTDLTAFGKFLFIGLVGLIIASLVQLFMQSSALQFAISVIGVFIFAGLTAYDTQRLKQEYYEGYEGETAAKMSILGALSLYINFIGMFQFLLTFLGQREE